MNKLKDYPCTITTEGAPAEQKKGFSFTGKYVACNGQVLPVYEPAERADGLPSINTPAGWKNYRLQSARAALVKQGNKCPTLAEIEEQAAKEAELAKKALDLIAAGASDEEIEELLKGAKVC